MSKQHSNNSNKESSSEAVAASVKTLGEMASALGIQPAESVESRRSLTGEGIVPEVLTEVAVEVAARYPELCDKHFDLAGVSSARASIPALKEVAGMARALLREVEDEILRRQAKVGTESRALYRFLTAIAPTPLGAPIREPLDRMTRSMRKGPKRTSKSAPADAAKTQET